MKRVLICALLLTACSRATPPVDHAVPAPAASAPAPVASATADRVSYVATTLEVGVHVDVPGFMTHREGADVDTSFSGEGARMTLMAEGACGRSMKEICRPLNASEKSFVRTFADSTCLETGTVGDRIVWRRHRVADGVEYEMVLEYPAAAKLRFDPIIEHVSKSWTVPSKATDGYRCD